MKLLRSMTTSSNTTYASACICKIFFSGLQKFRPLDSKLKTMKTCLWQCIDDAPRFR